MSSSLPKGGRTARTCVVVSYWTGLPVRSLHDLLYRMQRVDAGCPFDLVLVCNGGDQRPLVLPRRFDDLNPRILNRENANYNLGAWDHGWRNAPGYEYYLFLQDDCILKQPDWVYGFERRMDLDAGVGLLGEVERGCGMSWRYVRGITARPGALDPDQPWFDFFRTVLSIAERNGASLGTMAHHIPSIILFTRRGVLEQVGGFRDFGPTKEDAVAAEIAFSREIVARGHRISRIGDVLFSFIGHAQWRPDGAMTYDESPWKSSLKEVYRKLRGEWKIRFGKPWKARRLPNCCSFPLDDELPYEVDSPGSSQEAGVGIQGLDGEPTSR